MFVNVVNLWLRYDQDLAKIQHHGQRAVLAMLDQHWTKNFLSFNPAIYKNLGTESLPTLIKELSFLDEWFPVDIPPANKH